MVEYRITYTTGTAISLTGGTGVGVSDAKGSLNAYTKRN